MGFLQDLFASAHDNDGDVEVEYTGRELYHICGNNGEYDAKIEVKPNGDLHYYESDDEYWEDHSHDVYDRNGNHLGGHPDGEGHPWEHRQHD